MLKKKENQKLALRHCNYLRECLEEMVNNDFVGDDLEEILTNIDNFQRALHRNIYSEK